MRKDNFTKEKAQIFARCAKFVGYLSEDELLKIFETMVNTAESEPEPEKKGEYKII